MPLAWSWHSRHSHRPWTRSDENEVISKAELMEFVNKTSAEELEEMLKDRSVCSSARHLWPSLSALLVFRLGAWSECVNIEGFPFTSRLGIRPSHVHASWTITARPRLYGSSNRQGNCEPGDSERQPATPPPPLFWGWGDPEQTSTGVMPPVTG